MSGERAAADRPDRGMPTLEQIMTADVYTTTGDAPVAEVAGSMLKGRFGSAVVLDGNWIVGMFTERDVLRAAASGADLKTAVVSDWMTPDPVTAAPDMDADDAAEVMMTQGFRHLPVVEGNELKGIVSLRDVLRMRIRRDTN
jgi:CBS domain-containing protein